MGTNQRAEVGEELQRKTSLLAWNQPKQKKGGGKIKKETTVSKLRPRVQPSGLLQWGEKTE